jgi:hypothetical protein
MLRTQGLSLPRKCLAAAYGGLHATVGIVVHVSCELSIDARNLRLQLLQPLSMLAMFQGVFLCNFLSITDIVIAFLEEIVSLPSVFI